jgi:hypothetical protein
VNSVVAVSTISTHAKKIIHSDTFGQIVLRKMLLLCAKCCSFSHMALSHWLKAAATPPRAFQFFNQADR